MFTERELTNKFNVMQRQWLIRPYLLCLVSLLYSLPTSAQSDSSVSQKSFFSQRSFGKYFIADIYSPFTKLQAGAGLNLREYNINTSRKALYVFYNETDLAVEVPIYSATWLNRRRQQTRLAISIPVSTNIWFDFTEQITAPILNTDYRFALVELNVLRELNRRHLKNVALKLIPFFHESTHLGDELVINRVSSALPITRVNISYEVAEAALTLNDPNGRAENNHAFKIGVRALLNPSKGWYSIRSVEGDTTKVVPSRRWAEQYAQYQYQQVRGWLASRNAWFILSLEVRNRVQFGYPFYLNSSTVSDPSLVNEIQNNEQRRLCFNGYMGWKFSSNSANIPRLGAYLRAYTGLNPHGQFRNIPFYQFLGLSIVYEN